jgi:hypothetical protein
MPKAAGVKANIAGKYCGWCAESRRFRGYLHHSLCGDDGSITVPFPEGGAAVRTGFWTEHRRFAHALNDADPDIPILKEAKAEYAKLQ